jgi:hypothetical protein
MGIVNCQLATATSRGQLYSALGAPVPSLLGTRDVGSFPIPCQITARQSTGVGQSEWGSSIDNNRVTH